MTTICLPLFSGRLASCRPAQTAAPEEMPIGISSGAAVWAAIQLSKRPENKGKQIVVIVPSSSERYLSTWLFTDISAESDSVDDLIPAVPKA